MIKKLENYLKEVKKLTSQQESRSAAIALVRIILQHAVISLVELLSTYEDIAKKAQYSINWDLLRKPADGTLLTILAELLVAIENAGVSGISRSFWRSYSSRPAERLLEKNTPFTLENMLKGFVTLRNDAVEGHGIPGNFDTEAELDAVEMAITELGSILPSLINADGSLIVSIEGLSPFPLKLLRSFNDRLVCYREIKKTLNEKCNVKVQVQETLFERYDLIYEADDVFLALGFHKPNVPEYRSFQTNDDQWKPDVIVPGRLTTRFAGREREMDELVEWINDIDSRACMLFGDGGIGKTTLAIEFVHRLLEETINTEWKPQLVTFYTAKQTRWGHCFTLP